MAVDNEQEHEMSGLVSWMKLKSRFWSRSQRSLMEVDDAINVFQRPKTLKDAFKAKEDVIKLIREGE